MLSITTAALAALVSIANAVPTAEKAGFTINQVDSGPRNPNAAALYKAALRKHKAFVPPAVSRAAANFQYGSVSANPVDFDREYLSPVFVGTPGKQFNVQIDTGSSDFWVFSTLQPAAQSQGHHIYNPSSSRTSQRLAGETFNITYGDQAQARGVLFSDKVVVGGVTATSQAVGAATAVTSDLTNDTVNDGIFGFGFDGGNTATPSKVKTWFSNVAPSLPSPIFAANLHRGRPGSYDFGFINKSRFCPPLTFTKVTTAIPAWVFRATGYGIGSKTVQKNITALADTGTTLVLLPDAIIAEYYSQVKGAENNTEVGGFIFPCRSFLPDFTLLIDGVPKTVPGSFILSAPITNAICFGGLQSNQGLPFSVIGDIFLKSQYVVFDPSVPRIGFANQVNP